MITTVHWTFLGFLGLLLVVQPGLSLRCWDCSSNTNPLCGDPMNTTEHHATFHIKDCEISPYQNPKPVCRKTVQKVYGERVVIRSCSLPNADEIDIVDGKCGSMVTSSNHPMIESCHICSTDMCNSAVTASGMQVLYAGALALSMVLGKYHGL